MSDPSMNGSPIVRMRGVRKAFGDKVILDGLDLDVLRGSNLVIMGGSGSGKSVTLKTICGLLRPDAGTIEVQGQPVDASDPKSLRAIREKMGFLFQSAALINWLSAWENVALPLRERGVKDPEIRQRVTSRLADVGLDDIGDKFPSELSGGMRKRVGFARAVVLEPDLVLYDEPTTGLDPITTRTVDDLIVGARDRLGATGIVVSHDVKSALRVADHIGLLHEGRLETILTPAEFIASDHPVIRSFRDDTDEDGDEFVLSDDEENGASS